MKILLDTCAILWTISAPQKLSKKARKAFENIDGEFFISPISGAELACAVDRKKIVLDRHWKIWFRYFIDQNSWNIIDIDLPIIEEAYSLPGRFHSDPADRILVATSRLHHCTLMTADKLILDYPHVETIW